MTDHRDGLDLDGLDARASDRLLRRTLVASGFSLSGQPAADADTRARLEQALETLEGAPGEIPEASDPDVTLPALRVLAADPDLRQILENEPRREQPKDFAIDPISLASSVTLALLVLSAYVDVRRDSEGRWSFHFRIRPQSDALKGQLIKLARAVLPKLPSA
jgi:hypothetical protein